MNKTIFITGATAGFGEASARIFAKQDTRLILSGRRTEKLKELQAELGGEESVHILTLDVRSRSGVEAAVGELPDRFKGVDVLINNAGLALGLGPAHEADLDDWETMIDTNIKGMIYCTRNLLPGMKSRNTGHVINLGSIAGDWPYPGGNVYGATKAFVKQFSRNLRADLFGTGIRVTNIEPGMAETEFSVVRFKGDREKADQIYKGLDPLRPEDIAGIISWTVNLPAHVNINRVEVMPTCQSWGHLAVHRETSGS